MIRNTVLGAVTALALFFSATPAVALGECGMACCLLSSSDGMTGSDSLTISIKYEYMYMKTIKNGTDVVDAREHVTANVPMMEGMKYMTSDFMVMQKYNVLASYPVNDKLVILGHLPYIVNDMDMFGGTRKADGSIMYMTTSMDQISGIGDASLFALYTVYEDQEVRPDQRLTVGVGIKAPTGDYQIEKSDGKLVHAMMQPGSGSWDPIIIASYFKRLGDFGMNINALYQYTTEGAGGYEFGDQFAVDLTGSYNYDFFNFKLALNSIYAGQDTDHDGNYSAPAMSMIDNPENTGITSLFVTPAVQYKIPNTGGAVEMQYQMPIYQDANGYQQVMDWRMFVTVSWGF